MIIWTVGAKVLLLAKTFCLRFDVSIKERTGVIQELQRRLGACILLVWVLPIPSYYLVLNK
jgi:hypothetical protein